MSNKPAPSIRECLQKGRVTIWFGVMLLVIPIAICWLRAGDAKDALAAFGAVFLGGLIGMFVGFFAHEADQWNLSAMVGAATVLTGSGALAFLRYVSGGEMHEVWFYPIGLVAGYGFGTIWEVIDPANAND